MASRLGETLFALVHLGLLLAIVVYAAFLLVRGEYVRGGLVFAILAVYYVLVLHKAVRRELARKRGLKRK
jgi:membrane protein implicated in regulation of membrane protease activity